MTYETLNARIDIATIAELVEWLNHDGKDATAEQARKISDALDSKVQESNDASKKARMDSLFAMERADFWKSYATHPYYAGKKISETPEDGYKVIDADLPLKFKTLEKAYQDANTKASTLCAQKQWDIAVALFNHYLQDDILDGSKGAVKVLNGINTDKLNKAIAAMPECFASNTKQNRILMLKHICNAMCGEEMGVKAMSFDVKYLQIAVARAKKGAINTLNNWALTDEIIVVIGNALDVDGNGKRKTMYDFNNKGGFAVKKSK